MTNVIDKIKDKKPRAKKPVVKAWTPPYYTNADIAAIQALHRGEADAYQQRRALNWIINTACATYDLSYWPDSARDTDFALGRQFVGQQLVKLTLLNPNKLQQESNA